MNLQSVKRVSRPAGEVFRQPPVYVKFRKVKYDLDISFWDVPDPLLIDDLVPVPLVCHNRVGHHVHGAVRGARQHSLLGILVWLVADVAVALDRRLEAPPWRAEG